MGAWGRPTVSAVRRHLLPTGGLVLRVILTYNNVVRRARGGGTGASGGMCALGGFLHIALGSWIELGDWEGHSTRVGARQGIGRGSG